MKRTVNPFEYAGAICEAMKQGILLTTREGDFVNTMTIGWGTLGIEWGKPVFVAYVRESRHTRSMLDATGEFTVNIPMANPDKNVLRVCGTRSGRDLDKIRELGLNLEAGEKIQVPGILEFPLTLECRVLFRNVQDESRLDSSIRDRYYTSGNTGDYHIAYYGEIVNAYIAE